MATLYRIPKEIKGENKIALNMNAKQLIACSIALGTDLAIYFTMHLPIDIMLMITLVLVALALVTSTKTIDGVSIGHYLFNEARKMAFHYDKRKYRTKNRIISALNDKYSEIKAEDMQNKRIAKKIASEEKKQQKKKTRLKAIY